MENPKKRNKKTITEQMIIIVDYIRSNKIMISGKCHPMKAKELEEKWDELVNILNTVDNGARKDKKQWKHFLAEWKSKVKKKARTMTESLKQTGGGGGFTELSDVENKLLDLIGWVSINGCDQLPPEIDPNGDVGFEDIQIDPINEIEFEEINDSVELETIQVEIMEDLPTPVATSDKNIKAIYKTRKSNKPRSGKQTSSLGGSSLLQQSAEVYSESSKCMAEALKEMASSVSELAAALSLIARALNQTQSSE